MKYFIVAAIAIIAGLMVIPGRPKPAPKLLPIVRLLRSSDKAFFCSGTVISPHRILTAAHCVAGAPKNMHLVDVQQYDRKGQLTPASVVEYNERTDLALLSGDFTKYAHYDVETRPAEIVRSFKTHQTAVCGFPHAGNMYCNQFKFIEQLGFGMAGMAHMWPGMSGGPVFDVATGKIIAVNTGYYENYAIVSPTVELFDALHVKPE